jgi:hypothetical protein
MCPYNLARGNGYMVLLQLTMGFAAALFLWGFIKLSFQAIIWIIMATVIASLLIPGAFTFVSGLLLVFIGMLAALGVLFIVGAFRS